MAAFPLHVTLYNLVFLSSQTYVSSVITNVHLKLDICVLIEVAFGKHFIYLV
jgi:hypothetical protein